MFLARDSPVCIDVPELKWVAGYENAVKGGPKLNEAAGEGKEEIDDAEEKGEKDAG